MCFGTKDAPRGDNVCRPGLPPGPDPAVAIVIFFLVAAAMTLLALFS